ncbi:MAG: hypothetical protein LUC93_16420 [Planctomycetaceae bacterium]|nr:hypothetical protein [Planctomycetaceae bacterium]
MDNGYDISLGLVVLAGLPLVAGTAYLTVYAALRCWGKLDVTADGWHAGSVHLGRRVVCSALRLFAAFQSVMRFESALARLWRRKPDDQGEQQTVSEVVVELVQFA